MYGNGKGVCGKSCFQMSQKPIQEPISAQQAKTLAAELSELSLQQAIALRNGAFVGMTQKQAKEFDQRRDRISQLSTILGKLKRSALIG
jgi:hypothetical protein